ncbi:MAG: methylated-DNA--[protein]-cysteine S-methyltransferase [Chloroflexi bacterium]|nr:methylated-DNA--[protein]-cysteine S-methyltransferase [Chloroflexota bacterium]
MNPKNRVYFQSREEAKAQGYRACKVCKPDSPPVEPESFFLTHYRSPLGSYAILSSKQGIVCVEPEEEAKNRSARWQHNGVQIREGESEYNSKTAAALDGYFAGRLSHFDLPLDLRGTPFQRQVWQRLQGIPYGETISYGDLAHSLGKGNAARAVGAAVGSNPISIIVPCHRVIGSNGKLTGYGGGLPRKSFLLDLEANARGKKG